VGCRNFSFVFRLLQVVSYNWSFILDRYDNLASLNNRKNQESFPELHHWAAYLVLASLDFPFLSYLSLILDLILDFARFFNRMAYNFMD